MNELQLTALATILLALVGGAQLAFLFGQRQQQRLDWAESYRRRWIELQSDWATVVFLGRRASDYYQVAHHEKLRELQEASMKSSNEAASSWAQASVRNVCGMLSDLCSRILQGQLEVRDVYPIFGTELLRQGAPLRVLLDGNAEHLKGYGRVGPNEEELGHDRIRSEIINWLVCHDGMRRRCLIMIDLLWAEAARLEDLPPYEIKAVADIKIRTGNQNRARLRAEIFRLNRWSWLRMLALLSHLKHSEWRGFFRFRGISKKRLAKLDDEWNERYLRM